MLRIAILRILAVSMFVVASSAYAGKVELTTYYPAPFGEYKELRAKKLAAGDDLPDRDGDLRLKPQDGNPASWADGTQGQIAYSSTNDALYHHNGSTWVASGVGSPTTIYLKGFGTYSSAAGGYGYQPAYATPACPSGWTSQGLSHEMISNISPGLYYINEVRVCTKN